MNHDHEGTRRARRDDDKPLIEGKAAQGIADVFGAIAPLATLIFGGLVLYFAGGFIIRTLEGSVFWTNLCALARQVLQSLWRLLFGG